MSIPISSTTITVYKYGSGNADGFDLGNSELAPSVTGVRAHFASPSFSDSSDGKPVQSMRLTTDPCDLKGGDVVEDELTGQRFDVQWAKPMYALLPHVNAAVWFQGGK